MVREIRTVAIIGTGIMGRGIAQMAALSGCTVRVFDTRAGAVDEAIQFVTQMLNRQVEKGTLPADRGRAAIESLQPAAELAQLGGSDLLIEAIQEDLAAKQTLFRSLEAIVGPDAILATNTSSLSVTSVASACDHPQRVVGAHFFNPVPLMKVVEVIPAVQTDPAILPLVEAWIASFGHRAVRVSDSPGFLVNHAGRGLGTEALRMLQEQVATTDQIDQVVRDVVGLPMGPFQLFDLTGMDVSSPVLEQIYTQFFQDPRLKPSYLAKRQLAAGRLGRKTGHGWYQYADGKRVDDAPETTSTAARIPVWIDHSAWGRADWLSELVSLAGWELDGAARPHHQSLCLVAPLGEDATSVAVRLELDATRVVAVDATGNSDKRRTAMTTSVTAPEFRDAAIALLAAGGAKVTMIHDSPGFIAQRVVAQVVNTAADIAQQRIATPDDIDAAVRLGLGYRQGPLELGDAWGPATVLEILEAMQRFYGDDRYRPSPWLKRRAMLGVSLKTLES